VEWITGMMEQHFFICTTSLPLSKQIIRVNYLPYFTPTLREYQECFHTSKYTLIEEKTVVFIEAV